MALELCERWLAKKRLGQVRRERREWVVKHALRGLIKKGHARALAAVGFQPALLELETFEVAPRRVPWNGSVQLHIELRSKAAAPQALLIDYAVHLKKANGAQRPKTFKGREVTLASGEALTIEKKHSFREVTTRKHYPGEQRFELLVNGRSLGTRKVELLADRSGS